MRKAFTVGSASAVRPLLHALSRSSMRAPMTSATITKPVGSLAGSLWRRPGCAFPSGKAMMSSGADAVVLIKDMDAYKTACTQSQGKLIIAYHTASWCGPCKMIWPHVLQLATSNPQVVFLKIDVDEADDVAAANSVSAVPTFLFLKDGETKDKLVGASPPQLQAMITKHA